MVTFSNAIAISGVMELFPFMTEKMVFSGFDGRTAEDNLLHFLAIDGDGTVLRHFRARQLFHQLLQRGAFGEILLTGIISTLNDHQLDGLDVEPRNAESTDLVRSILSNYWGVEGREELIDTLRYLIVSGHTMDYVSALEAISSGKDASALHTEDMDEDDVAVSDARFAFTEAYAGKVDPAMLRGWDLGRAANVARWGYFVGFITVEETWGILDQIADGCMETFDSWRAFAQSYIFGSMYWKCPYGPDACYENIAGLMFAVEHLLTEGEWKDFPWASGRA